MASTASPPSSSALSPSINLRDALLSSLAGLPGTRTFHIHVLISSPRKHSSLFPYARPRPRTYLQDILVLVSEQSAASDLSSGGASCSSLEPRILVSAVEACLYTLPATSSAILYVSKVDSTGQGQHPSPTSTLVRALLKYYANPRTRPLHCIENFWIHLFARAQNQYLFPNSSEHPKKKVLSDVKLCAWWKQVLTDVAEDVLKDASSIKALKLHYILPGFSEAEATTLLNTATVSNVTWEYGHPYSQTDIPLPCPPEPTGSTESNKKREKNLGHFIPWFDDDPKSRFIDEIAYIKTLDGEELRSPARKRLRGGSPDESDTNESARKEKPKKRLSAGGEKEERPLGELCQVTPDEFWERMSFRQECVAGAITGFFTLAVRGQVEGSPNLSALLMAPQAGHLSSQINKRIMTSLLTGVEFSTTERSARSTEMLESAIRGLCDEQGGAPPPDVPRGGGVGGGVSGPRGAVTYGAFVYGSVGVSNPGVQQERQAAGQIRVLSVRKKKRRVE